MPCYDSKTIFEENGTDEEYELKFQGDCKNDVDAYCDPWDGEKPVELPEDHEDAILKQTVLCTILMVFAAKTTCHEFVLRKEA